MEENQSQKSIRDYFKVDRHVFSDGAESKMSKRVQKAVRKIGKESSSEDEQKPAKSAKANAKRPMKKHMNPEGEASTSKEDDVVPKKRARRTKVAHSESKSTIQSEEIKEKDVEIQEKPKKKPRVKKVSDNQTKDQLENETETKTPNQSNPKMNLSLVGQEVTAPHPKIKTSENELHQKIDSEVTKGETKHKKPRTNNKRTKVEAMDEDLTEKRSRLKKSLTKEMPNTKDGVSKKKPKGKFPFFKNVEDEAEKKLAPELAKAMKLLNATKAMSQRKVKEIETEVRKEVETVVQTKKDAPEAIVSKLTTGLNQREYIHQKEKGRIDILRNKMKAIETFRKSKQGPGYVKKRSKVVRVPKEDAGLSESSDES